MAMINCPECGKEISDKAKNCIYCGYPVNEESNPAPSENQQTITIVEDSKKAAQKKQLKNLMPTYILQLNH